MRFCLSLACLFLPFSCFASTSIYFPQIADGAGYQTTVTIFNPGKSAVTGTLRFYTPKGTAWLLSVNSTTKSAFAVSLPASGSARFRTAGTAPQISTGWASLESAGVLVGVATFEVRSQGKLSESVGILGASAVKRFMVPVDYDSGNHEDVGVAIVNTSDSNFLTVNLSLLDDSGNLVQASPDPEYQGIGSHGYIAKYASQAFPDIPLTHKGTLLGEVSGDGAMAVIGLVLKDGMQSAIPVSEVPIMGKVIAWGWNDYGQTDVPAEAQSGVNAISAGGVHSLALKNGQVIAWGWKDDGVTDVPMEAQDGVSAISAGSGGDSLALKNGQVIAWGLNDHGEADVPVEARSGVSAIAAGRHHSLALKNGRVIAWGNNEYGQIDVPVEAQSGVSAIAAGDYHSLALKNGRVIAWGTNEDDQTDVPIEAQSGVSAIVAGYYHSLALKNGRILAWGSNSRGQTDVPMEAQSGVSAIAAGSAHSSALKNGRVIAWGGNYYGVTDVPVEAQSGVSAITAGAFQALVLK